MTITKAGSFRLLALWTHKNIRCMHMVLLWHIFYHHSLVPEQHSIKLMSKSRLSHMRSTPASTKSHNVPIATVPGFPPTHVCSRESSLGSWEPTDHPWQLSIHAKKFVAFKYLCFCFVSLTVNFLRITVMSEPMSDAPNQIAFMGSSKCLGKWN